VRKYKIIKTSSGSGVIMAVTLKDIAEKAGVSTSTVSRVFNKNTQSMVNDETAETVMHWANKLGYTVYKESSDLEKLKIGCILSEVTSKFNHPYFLTIIEKIEQEIKDRGHKLAFLEIEEDIKKEGTIDELLNQELDGVISISDHLSYELYNKINKRTKNIVFIGNRFNKYIKDAVNVNREEAAYKAVKYLINNGHKKIAFIGGDIYPVAMEKTHRYLGYAAAMQEAGLEIDKELIEKGDWSVESGCGAIKKIFERAAPSAAFISSDQMAIGALKTLHYLGIKIPADFSIVSYDNLKMARFTNPPLTTVNVPKKDLALMAVNILLMRINNNMNSPCIVTLPTKIIKRESVAKLVD
jgi:DNA-binding LacI/PurR family transcriptional regulator